jgi:hypothetical protein
MGAGGGPLDTFFNTISQVLFGENIVEVGFAHRHAKCVDLAKSVTACTAARKEGIAAWEAYEEKRTKGGWTFKL